MREGFKSSDEQGKVYAKGLNANFQPRQLTKSTSEEAKQWDGWGTSLKPAIEPILLVRKKIDGKNLADNILKWRVGGLNIDETKVGVGKRWAANVIINHDENCSDERCVKNCAVRILDEQSGIRQSGKENGSATVGVISNGSITPMRRGTLVPRDDVGGASRFFYCPKISSSERNLLSSNAHPTVKPIKLMSYLCKLITPPEGIILDPFMGTGSTGIAALLEDFNFIGVEREKEYFETAKIRIENYLDFGKFLGKNNTPPETTLF